LLRFFQSFIFYLSAKTNLIPLVNAYGKPLPCPALDELIAANRSLIQAFDGKNDLIYKNL